MMQITVNGESRDVREPVSVAELLQLLQFPDRGVAVALNGAVVPKARWTLTLLSAQSDIEILTAVQGG